MKPKIIMAAPLMTEAESDKLVGKVLGPGDFKQLITYDCDVFDKVTGKCLAKFRKNIIPGNVQLDAYNSLIHAAKLTDSNRGTAGGKQEGGAMRYRMLKSGKRSNTLITDKTEMGIVGYFDRTVRFPNCRLTAFTKHEFEKFRKAYPIIKFVDNEYAALMPKEYALQRGQANKTSQDFVIKNTAFSTVTVNKNWQTAVHKDKGDFKDGFGNLVALRKGKFLGGYLVLVRWGIGFDLQNGDLLLMDVHQWHANTPIIYDGKDVVRLSLVMYYRERMIDCGTMAQELKRVKNRRKGDPVFKDKPKKK